MEIGVASEFNLNLASQFRGPVGRSGAGAAGSSCRSRPAPALQEELVLEDVVIHGEGRSCFDLRHDLRGHIDPELSAGQPFFHRCLQRADQRLNAVKIDELALAILHILEHLGCHQFFVSFDISRRLTFKHGRVSSEQPAREQNKT